MMLREIIITKGEKMEQKKKKNKEVFLFKCFILTKRSDVNIINCIPYCETAL